MNTVKEINEAFDKQTALCVAVMFAAAAAMGLVNAVVAALIINFA